MLCHHAEQRLMGRMPKTLQSQEHQNDERLVLEEVNSAIKEQIIAALGKPSDLLRVVARPLWERHYRVNVFVGSRANGPS